MFDVYADAWDAVRFFLACSTQWRVGMSGPTGLDYVAVRVTMDLLSVKRDERFAMFDAVTTMERAALSEWSAMREERAAEREAAKAKPNG